MPIKCALAQVGIAVTMKLQFTLWSVFLEPKDVTCDKKNYDLVHEIPSHDSDTVNVGETGCSLNTRKIACKCCARNECTKISLCQHIVTCNNFTA